MSGLRKESFVVRTLITDWYLEKRFASGLFFILDLSMSLLEQKALSHFEKFVFNGVNSPVE
jgi:hypothetical protein